VVREVQAEFGESIAVHVDLEPLARRGDRPAGADNSVEASQALPTAPTKKDRSPLGWRVAFWLGLSTTVVLVTAGALTAARNGSISDDL